MIRRMLAIVGLLAASGIALGRQDEERGLKLHEPGAFEGLNLFAPLEAATTYLMDNDGRVIRTWESEYRPGSVPYLLPDGRILRPGSFGNTGNGTFRGGGAGYLIEEFTWEGEKTWEFVYSSEAYLMHHDVEPLPNGNVSIVAWERKTRDEAIAAGRNPEMLREDEVWSEHIIEVRPVRPEGAEIVWEWRLWDHLIQDFDPEKDNYGEVARRPELVDINPLGGRGNADWLHVNSIAYNPAHDLIALSVHNTHELWILDHSVTTEEAKGHSGGRYGKGGDLLYRWGNPAVYRMGAEADQRLFAQHDVHWIAEGRPGAGNILVFNNGQGRGDGGNYSSIVEIEPPFTAEGGFAREEGGAWGPTEPIWEYTAPRRQDFYSSFISGAQRQPNGNTLICSGASGIFFEVTPEGREVWRYINPVNLGGDEGPGAGRGVGRGAVRGERGRRGGGGGRGGGGNSRQFAVFRVYRFGLDYPAFEGRDLTPGPLLTDYLKDHPAKRPRGRGGEPRPD